MFGGGVWDFDFIKFFWGKMRRDHRLFLFELYFKVRFIVGGDGPKRVRLEEMREKHCLQDRVEMLGAVPHARVRSVLISGHIFLNR